MLLMGIAFLVFAVCLILFIQTQSGKKQKEEFNTWLGLLSAAVDHLKKAPSALAFANTWKVISETCEQLRTTYKPSLGKALWESTKDALDAVDSLRNSEDFYWLLRNAIERDKDQTINNIKTTYKNSETYKQQEYERFCSELDQAKHIFNEETIEFANACIDEVSYALNGASARRMPDKDEYVAEQRRLVTPSLRYDIMKRDGFRCVICGRGAEDGVKLHVDHIKPVSKGGKTTPSNLRTLCQECNAGKGAKTEDDTLDDSIDVLEAYSALDDD